ncbi:MAG TPA: ectoine synthase [Cellvibrio sp.]|nr:ectoine synthase [Cellvibrio sp.]
MIIRNLKNSAAEDRLVKSNGWESNRLLLKSDGVGFSFHITHIYPGAKLYMHYQHHIEAVYCIRGTGEIEDMANNEIHPINPGTLYILNEHDKHILRAWSELELACVFNPPLHGKEVHNAEGAFELIEPV